MVGLCEFFEQSKRDGEKCNVIFKAINAYDNGLDQIVVKNLSQNKNKNYYNDACNRYFIINNLQKLLVFFCAS